MVSEKFKRGKCAPYQKMMGLSTASELYGTPYKNPKFIVNMGKNCFTDNESIVLGLMHSVFDTCETEVDLYEHADYVRGHEIQHIKSTTDKAWKYGIKRGTEIVIEELLKQNQINLRLRTDADYNLALQKLREKNCFVNMAALQNIAHFICNSLEDGRIEYIRANQNETFKKQMVHIRLKNWMNEPIEEVSVDKMDTFKKLTVVLNQVLSLSTSQVYQKGFAHQYFGTELQELLETCIPYIAKAVIAKTCRECMGYAISIAKELAPVIAESVASDQDNTKIIEWIRMSIRDIDSFEPKTKESNEEEGPEENNNPFGQSDLYVILPDDEYDEFMEKHKDDPKSDGDDNGSKMHIRREHPKEEEEKNEIQKPEQGGGNGQNEEQNPYDQTDSGTTDGANDKNTDSSVKDDVSSEENAPSGSGEQNANAASEHESGNANSDGEQKQGGCDDQSNTDSDSGKSEGSSDGGSGGNNAGSGADDIDAIEEKIRQEMKEAEEIARERAETDAEIADQTIKRQEKAQDTAQDVEEKQKPTDTSKINELYNFNVELLEIDREFKVDEMLPPELMQEIETLQKKLENYMKDKKKRFRRQIMEGKLDSSRAAMLAANEINVFKQTKKSAGIAACAEIICDNSGSMGWGIGSKREAAAKAMAKIEMAFAKYFPVKLFAYDEEGAVIHQIIKGFGEHFSRSAAWNWYLKGRYGGGTLDDYSIRVATQQISERPEKKKLLIVLSDGQQRDEEVLNAVRDARAKGITVVGIYISNCPSDNDEHRFANMYDNRDYILATSENLDFELIRIMKKFFLS